MSRCTDSLVCPVCGDRLDETGRSFRCPRGHAYDRSREGYVHLLPAGHGRSRLEGDVADMVRARRRFLERGHFEPLVDALAHALRDLQEERRARSKDDASGPTVLDVGCGDGYYGGRLREAVQRPCCFFGLDLSKQALRLAARAYPDILFFVNDVRHRICLADASVDLLIDVFAPRNPVEFARVLHPHGLALVVIPNPEHLRELREHLPLLEIDADKRERTEERLAGRFELVGLERIEHRMTLAPGEAVDLIRMTPNYWHADEPALRAAARLGETAVTASVSVLRFRKRQNQEPALGALDAHG